jgi:hypothetical protein
VQLSDFRGASYTMPVYPVLFFFAARAIARCQETFPRGTGRIQTVFVAILIVLGIGAHAPVFSLERPGFALSAKGYSYGVMPDSYVFTHEAAGSGDRDFIPQLVERPFLSDIMPKLSSEDRRQMSLAIVALLAEAAPLNGPTGKFSRIERLVPPRFAPEFYYCLGIAAMERHQDLKKAVAAVTFLERRSPTLHRLALIGIYRVWPQITVLDAGPESLADSPARVAPEMQPHYWRAVGYLAGRYWYDKDRSLSQLNGHVHAFLPWLDPSVQRYFLQGVGRLLFTHLTGTPAKVERLPQAYQQGLFEGWGMELGEHDLFSGDPWKGRESPFWTAWTRGLSDRSQSYIQQGKEQFGAFFESALEPTRPAS